MGRAARRETSWGRDGASEPRPGKREKREPPVFSERRPGGFLLPGVYQRPSVWMVSHLSSVYSSMEYRPPSRPTPLSRTPPEGAVVALR